MKPTERFDRGWSLKVVFLIISLFMCSCKYELVKEPTFNYNDKKNAADYNDFIVAPSSVTASHGLSKSVSIEWEAVPNAVQYYIYSCSTPYDTFTKVSETKGSETQIIIDEESGITKYYCVSAVNYYGTVSLKSVVTCGSTLSVPIITEITSAEEGDSLTVNWWMDNCRPETYESNISYEISVYLNATSNIKQKTLTASGNCRSLTVDDLMSKTEYYFTVEAINSNNKDKEISTRTSALTAHRVIPAPAADFTVTQGSIKDKVELSWTLPPKVWYRTTSGSSGFELYPLYFEIYRKEAGSSANFALLKKETITAYPEDTTTERTHTYTDSDVTRGKQYEYYIQSFTDGLPEGKTVTADSSKTSVKTGWALSVPNLSIKSDYEKEEGTFTSINFILNLEFEAYDVPYTYVLKRTGEKLPAEQTFGGTASKEQSFSSIMELKNYTDSFPSTGKTLVDEKGYYSYCVEIRNENTVLDTAEASGKCLVTNDANAVPVIENFTVEEGYKDKFVLSWKFNSEYTYILHWKDYITGNNEASELNVSGTDGSTVTYNHTAASGKQYSYQLEAVKEGLSTFAYPNNDSAEKVYYTLGTPSPVITEYDYDKIIVRWDSVQMAQASYIVSAKYENNSTELSNSTNTTITQNEDNSFTCIFNNPDYNDALKSGKNIKLEVKAKSSAQLDQETTKTIDVCTVGPANINLSIATEPSHNEIVTTWNKVDGAKGYIIRRICGINSFVQEPVSSADVDIYYYDGTTLYAGSEQVADKRAVISKTNTGFKLTDKYCEPDNSTDSYESNQSYISWGIPYSYYVVPVKETGSADDFSCDESSISINGKSAYTNVTVQQGATYGYGLNVKAQKSDSSTVQIIEWKQPYITSNNTPSFFYREAGSSANTWKKINTYTLNGNEQVTFTPETQTGAYEYLVAYKRASASAVPLSLINDTRLGLSTEEKRTEYNYSNGVNKEKANKGYLLAVNLNADTGTDKSENVYWDEWDYENRSIGPDSAVLRIKNYNISDQWVKVASLDENLYYSSKSEPLNTTVTKIDDVTVNLKPTKIMDDDSSLKVTPGYMQVLRDAKHYYSLVLTKGESNCVVAEDDSVYAYRDIGEKELVKCALLNVAYGFYLDTGGKPDLSNVEGKAKYEEISSLAFDGTGSASFGEREYIWVGSEIGKYKADVSMNNFAPNMLNPSGKKTCVVKISFGPVSTRTKGGTDRYLDKFRTENFIINVSGIDNQMPASYNKDLIVTCTGKNNLTVKIGNTTIIDTSNHDTRCVYFPIQLDEDYWWFKDTSKGWWTE
ncbi:MAG: fibronectin type III domain-containing protein [Treponema sp.]|nr:fibronectin type III domain-containing protein [Treponema sp.]